MIIKLVLRFFILLLVFSALSCQKEELNVGDKAEGCEYLAFKIPPVVIEGQDKAGAIIDLEMDVENRMGSGTRYFWVKPDGTLFEGRTLKLVNLGAEHRGKYYAYYTANYGKECQSYKAVVEIKAPGSSVVTVPCNIAANYFDLPGVLAFENITMPAAKAYPSTTTTEIKAGTFFTSPSVEIELNVPQLAEGEYKLIYYNSGFPSMTEKYAGMKFRRSGNLDFWRPKAGEKLYIKKNSGGKFEIISCGAIMNYPGLSADLPLDMKLVVD